MPSATDDFLDRVDLTIYGRMRCEREAFVEARARHENEIREYFKNRPGDWLEIDICGGEGWEKLCPFLQREKPDAPFPRNTERVKS